MSFSSIIFIFFFLPLTLSPYFLFFLPGRKKETQSICLKLANIFLLLASLIFYFWGVGNLLWTIILSIVVNFLCGLAIAPPENDSSCKNNSKSTKQNLGLLFSLTFNIIFLGYFKYFNFGIENFNHFLSLLFQDHFQAQTLSQIVLPIGISFYTFQAISYSMDIYRGSAKPTKNFFDFACYLAMFPKLIAGPIVPYREIEHQLKARTLSSQQMASGITRLIFGLAKKVLIANVLAQPVNQIFALPGNEVSPAIAWIGAILYTIQIFFDFSGYSDMAIGLGQILGFSFPENFNFPYIARSIQDFWRRWHISLSLWLREYLYIPLGGNRVTPLRGYLNLIIVFLICGLWHGANWTFIIWGLWHGFFLVLEKFGLKTILKNRPTISHVYTLFVIIFGWVLFRSDSISHAFTLWQAMVSISGRIGLTDIATYLTKEVLIALSFGLLFSMPTYPFCSKILSRHLTNYRFVNNPILSTITTSSNIIFLLLIFGFSSITLASATYNPFIYFRF